MLRPSIEGWETCLDPDGGTTYLEQRAHGGAQVIMFRPGAPVAVSIDHGRSWHHGTLPVGSIYLATIAADVILRRLRAERARKATPGGMSLRDRLLEPEEREAEKAGRRAAAQAPAAPSRTPRAARREGDRAGGAMLARAARPEDAPPAWIRFDDPTARELARGYLAGWPPPVVGADASASLMSAAVAIVRGFCLLPETDAAPILAEYVSRSPHAIRPSEQRRALATAQRAGRKPWGCLLARSAAGRALWASWISAAAGAGGRGAGKGGRHG